MSTEKISVICIALAGVLIAVFAKAVCRKAQNVPQMRRLGVCIALVGVLLWFLP